ncbi:hypothetical protein [Nocardioides sp. MH1]|uniref:hypothetical protein n=1 Tax=Nocardioides sp. MH1 TaxID=3242490 RepID=UPI00351FDC15
MTRIKRPAAAVGAAALLAFSLTACGGGGSDAPDNASTDDYCDVVNDQSFFEDLGDDPSNEDFVDALKKYADKLKDVGTPDDISDDARKGFEIQLDAIDDLDPDEIDINDPDSFEKDFSSDDKDKIAAYTEYESKTCGGADDLELPSDLPTDLSDLPTDLSDLPTDLSDLTDLPSDFSDLTEIPTS